MKCQMSVKNYKGSSIRRNHMDMCFYMNNELTDHKGILSLYKQLIAILIIVNEK